MSDILEHIIEIVVMLLIAGVLGFFIAWFLRRNQIEKLEGYITALEEKNNRLQSDLNENEKLLIDCQTEKKKVESDKQNIENLLHECQGKFTSLDVKKADGNKLESKKPKKKAAKKKGKEKGDNLTKIEGIGPKIAGILKDAGIISFTKLCEEKPKKISELLIKAGGNSYNRFDPSTWPEQAKMAAEEKWEELDKWQEELKGGRKG